jgi:hypothetical protein
MGAIYYLGGTTSDLSGGNDFNKYLEESTGSETNVQVGIAGGTTETSYGFTRANVPGLDEFNTGTITVKVKPYSLATGYIYASVSASRVNASGVVQETSEVSDEQNLLSTDPYSFVIPSKDWGSGSSTDRLRINYHFRNGHPAQAKAFYLSLGTSDSSVTTTFGDEPPVSKTLIGKYNIEILSELIGKHSIELGTSLIGKYDIEVLSELIGSTISSGT